MRALGLVGVNVTMPLKAMAARVADRVSTEAEMVGAANTVVNEAGTLVAYNTDVEGFSRAVADLGLEMSGTSTVVVGAGGAARAVTAALVRGGADRVVVLARRRVPAQQTALLAGDRGRALPVGAPAAASAVAAADVVVNATPVGMTADELPVHLVAALGPQHALVDLVYAPPETPLIRAARATGARAAAGGIGMLVHQAGLAFTLFTGQPAPLDAMSASAVAAVASHLRVESHP